MDHCQRFVKSPMSRRDMLRSCACGFGALAATALQSGWGFAGTGAAPREADRSGGAAGPLTPIPPHHAPRARNVIFLYMDGGPSQVDTFDPKPRLAAEHGRPFAMKIERTQFNDVGNTLGSPWSFRRYGQSGLPVSELFPHVGRMADELCVVRSMTSRFFEHTVANYFLHTGSGLAGRPSMGAWVGYGLGSESRNLPGFVVLHGGQMPPGGRDNFHSAFLPAAHQGSIVRPGANPIANVTPLEKRSSLQRRKLALTGAVDRTTLERTGSSPEIEGAIANYELAFRMQAAVPELMDLVGETAATKALYGIDSDAASTRTYGTQCLLARRLVERGVRFVELTVPSTGVDRWDSHGNLRRGHELMARAVDQPIAGLLADLKSRGLLDETLVIWAGEFGRTPFSQGVEGRDHNPLGFTVWMAGGGVRRGTVYGATDDYGYRAVEHPLEMHDLHATVLHLLGLEHTRLTHPWGGRDMRLTDLRGQVVHELIA